MSRLSLTGSHSLWALTTFIMGDTPFPEFSAVMKLDDVQIAYFAFHGKKNVDHGQFKSVSDCIQEEVATLVFQDMYDGVKDTAMFLKKQHNYTDGKCVVTPPFELSLEVKVCHKLSLKSIIMLVARFYVYSHTMVFNCATWPDGSKSLFLEYLLARITFCNCDSYKN